MSQLSDQLRHFPSAEQGRDHHVRKANVLMPDPNKLSGDVHYQIEAWVNEGGAGGEDDGALFGDLFPGPRQSYARTVLP